MWLKFNDPGQLETLCKAWQAAWPKALTQWSRFTRLSDPRWCFDFEQAKLEGATSSFAMIRLTDHAVVINLPAVLWYGVQDYPTEILAHEIGHHIYCPGDLTDQARLLARIRRCLPTIQHHAPLIANLYADLLINDRLQRSAGLHMAGVYAALLQNQKEQLRAFHLTGKDTQDPLWDLYTRIYEVLWALPSGTLCSASRSDEREGDAILGARIVRAYAHDWLRGAVRFTMLCLPYLHQNELKNVTRYLQGWLDTKDSASGSDLPPEGLTEIDIEEGETPIHPLDDPALNGSGIPVRSQQGKSGSGQRREPFEYGELLKALGMKLSDHEAAVHYYREQALPHLVRFPSRTLPQGSDPLPEGLEPWDIGSPLENVDWLESVLASPKVIPSLTTLQRFWGQTEGGFPRREPLDLDLYVDSSGSMENPQQRFSYPALAGAIIALSALRAGSRIQVTLWSGARQFETTNGFVRDEQAVLRTLTGYIGGGTAFPIHILRETYAPRTLRDRPVHLLVISDEGVTTMFDKDEKGNSGWEIARMALENARGGGSFVLNLYQQVQDTPELVRAGQEGWQIFPIKSWEELLAFARAFSKQKFEPSR